MLILSPSQRAVSRLRQTVLLVLALGSASGCERFKDRVLGMGRSASSAPAPAELDSIASRRDSIVRRNLAAKDSLDAMSAVRRATDSLTHAARASASTATPVDPLPRSRAQILGDSIANAQAEKIAGQNLQSATGDTVRGVVQLDGKGPGSRPILKTNKGRNSVTLSGMGTDGLSQLVGSDVVVRGMRVSPGDIVVSGFSVRAVNGIPTIDGRLIRSGGGWAIELSDKTGLRRLPAVPEALQAFEGARVWVAEEGKNVMPQLYGVIARR